MLILGILGLPVLVLALIAVWVLVVDQLLKGIDEGRGRGHTK
jgi:hypothetical protein